MSKIIVDAGNLAHFVSRFPCCACPCMLPVEDFLERMLAHISSWGPEQNGSVMHIDAFVASADAAALVANVIAVAR